MPTWLFLCWGGGACFLLFCLFDCFHEGPGGHFLFTKLSRLIVENQVADGGGLEGSAVPAFLEEAQDAW